MMYVTAPDDFKPAFDVVSCFVECENKILLIRRNSLKPQGGKWGVPAGKVDVGETPQQAMIRELKEETGIEVTAKQISYGSKVYVRYPTYDYVYHVFHLRYGVEPEVTLNTEEHTKYQWLSPKQSLNIEMVDDQNPVTKMFYRI